MDDGSWHIEVIAIGWSPIDGCIAFNGGANMKMGGKRETILKELCK